MAVGLVGLLILLGSVEGSFGQNSTNGCQFGPGICPVTIGNVVDVFYFDADDEYSCQEHCLDLEECHFFTMYSVKDSPKNHIKCFTFKSCGNLEPCDECTTGITF